MAADYHWRETYFILFEAERRPSIDQMASALGSLSKRYELTHLMGDDDGRFESLTLNSPDDNAALEISYEQGEAVIEQTTELAKQLKEEAGTDELARLLKADARLDVMHFERTDDDPWAEKDEDDEEEFLDPSCLLMVIEAAVEVTDGIPIDPATGAIMP